MNSKVIIAGVSGLIVGAVGSFFVTKKVYSDKYKKEADERINQMDKMFREMIDKYESEREDIPEEPKDDIPSEEAKEMAKTVLKNCGYSSEESNEEGKEVDVPKKDKKIRRIEYITADELDEDNDFEAIRYTWYDNGVLVREDTGTPINSIEDIVDEIGDDFRYEFDNPEVQTVYIRDFSYEYDYIIERGTGSGVI